MTYLQTFILVFTALIIAMGNLFIPRYFDRQQELRDRSADCVTYRHYAQSYEVDVAKTGEFYMAKGDCTRISALFVCNLLKYWPSTEICEDSAEPGLKLTT